MERVRSLRESAKHIQTRNERRVRTAQRNGNSEFALEEAGRRTAEKAEMPELRDRPLLEKSGCQDGKQRCRDGDDNGADQHRVHRDAEETGLFAAGEIRMRAVVRRYDGRGTAGA